MVKKQKKTATEIDPLEYNLTDYDYDGPIKESKFDEEKEDNYEIDFDAVESDED